MNIFLGLLFVATGIAMIAYSGSIAGAFGRWDWADQHLGGTTQGYVLIGFVIIIVGFVIMFGGGHTISTDVSAGLPTPTK